MNGAEIVEGDAHPHLLEHVSLVGRGLRISHQH
jgi:hypothetical protein